MFNLAENKRRICQESTMIAEPTKSENVSGNVSLPDRHSWSKQRSADEIRALNSAAAMQRLFVIKKHNATRLHYDFRLGHNWVLKSWVVPEGPSYLPGEQREAIQVVDHRREYAFFEGVIAEGYGAGIVMLWDWGTWEPLPGHTDVDASLRSGLLKFILHGEKLKGVWVLTRVKDSEGNHGRPIWMLAKEQDLFARSETAESILEEAPNSISTRRTMEEIAENWNRGKNKNALQGELFGE
jgi:bifunctional non-homologous end joining protein LigD